MSKILKKLSDFVRDNLTALIIIFTASAVVSYFHYSVPLHFSAIHLAHYYIYYIIVIYAAYKFGFTGGIIVAALMTLIYSPQSYFHVAAGCVQHQHVPSIVEISMIYAVGIVSGYFSKQLKDEKKKVEKVSADMLSLERQMAHDDRLRVLGQLSAGIAHEIRNPLAAIKTGVSMIKNGKADGQITEILESEINRLDSFVSRFLQYAKFGKNVTEEFKADDFIAELFELAKLSCTGKDVALTYKCDTDAKILGDKNSLKQALLNLIINGIDAASETGHGKVSLEVCSEGDKIVFTVTDNGQGIKGDINRLFEPFYTTKDMGTGLGLAIASKIASDHGGGIQAETSDSGTKFIMTIKGA